MLWVEAFLNSGQPDHAISLTLPRPLGVLGDRLRFVSSFTEKARVHKLLYASLLLTCLNGKEKPMIHRTDLDHGLHPVIAAPRAIRIESTPDSAIQAAVGTP